MARAEGHGGARAERQGRLPYMPALDGLRALAVVAVLAFHADLTWAPAGFLGVDVFFVISGYLITAMLLAERRRTGRLDLFGFWRRRALRLLPALLAVLAVVSVAVPLLAPDQASRLRGDLVAALTYVSNWRLVFQHQPYFQAIGRPPLLQHLWSLAVEEQFYLAWPLVLAAAMAWGRRRSHRLIGWILAGAGVSALLMAVLYKPGTDPSRVYYGTDTRVGTILVGAALAFLWPPWRGRTKVTATSRAVLDAVGGAALVGLALCVGRFSQFGTGLYRGGFVLVAGLSAVAVAVTAHPGTGVLRRALGSGPMIWLGRRSYGIYLWHWPIFMLTRPHADVPLTGYPLFGLRLALTLVFAAASYRLIEVPARSGALRRVWGDVRAAVAARSPAPAATAMTAATLVVVAAIAAGVGIGHRRPASPASIALTAGSPLAVPATLLPPTTVPAPAPGGPAPEVAPATAPATAPPGPAPAAVSPPPPARHHVVAIGDSVLLDAKAALTSTLGDVVVDAAIGRQFSAIIAVARTLHDHGQLGDIVVIHGGTNSAITKGQFDQLLELLRDVPRVVVVNLKVPRPWESVDNRVIAAGVSRWPNAVLVDWHREASAHPEVFYDDGVHLRPKGVQLYVQLLQSALS